jgi:DNA repair protein RadC
MADKFKHPGDKLIELGPASLTETELLAILISPGIKGRPAEVIAADVLARYGSLEGLSDQPLEDFLQFKGLSTVKIVRLAAALEIALRVSRKAFEALKRASWSNG